jgi:hypothetical protein
MYFERMIMMIKPEKWRYEEGVSFDMIQCNSSRIAMASIDVLLTEEKKTIDCEAICLAID